MKKISRKLMKILLFFIYLLSITTTVLADVGSFESYDSGGSSWGGSSSSSWGGSSSSWGSSSRRKSSEDETLTELDRIRNMLLDICLIIAYVSIPTTLWVKYKKDLKGFNKISEKRLLKRQLKCESQIKLQDENFNKEEFIAWSSNLFIKLQQAWMERDWECIRTFETQSLFEQHKNQLQGYINGKQINIMEEITVNYATLYEYRIEGDKEILTVRLNSKMKDYIIDEITTEIIKGNSKTYKVNTYLLTFIRKIGVKTKLGNIDVNTTNCPNCGAPIKITLSGKCEYCNSIVTTGEFGWVLSNLEREDCRK